MGICDADTAKKSGAFPVLMQENNLFRKCLRKNGMKLRKGENEK